MSGSTPRKTLLVITVIFSVLATAHAWAVAPIEPFSGALKAAGLLGEIQDGVGTGLDILDASQDLLDEMESPSEGLDEFSQNSVLFNRKLNELKGDMSEIGYTKEDVSDLTDRFNSSRTSLAQKIRALRRTLHSIKRVKEIIAKNGGKDQTVYQKATLATEQQVLHLQLQQMQKQDLKDLEDRSHQMAFRKKIINDFNETAELLAKNKQNEEIYKPDFKKYSENNLRDWGFAGAIMTILVAAVLIMVLPFQEEGKILLKAGIAGIIFLYLIPLVINLYRNMLGI
jgi:hypothetical protein